MKFPFRWLAVFTIVLSVNLVKGQSELTVSETKKYHPDVSQNGFHLESKKGENTLVLFDPKTVSLKNFMIEFDVTPTNSQSKFGIVARYQNPKEWVYIGCDSTSDVLTHAHWNVRRPGVKKFLDKDIVKFYRNFKRSVLLKLEDQIVTVYVDGEKIIQKYSPELAGDRGGLGFMVHNGGDVRIANVNVRELSPLPTQIMSPATVLKNDQLEVSFAKGYPAVVNYKIRKSNIAIRGKQWGTAAFTINGINYRGTSSAKKQGDRMVYHTVLPEISLSFDTEFWLQDNQVKMRVINMKEGAGLKVKTLAFPDHDLVTMANNTPHTRLSIAHGVEHDEFLALADKPVDATSHVASIGILNDDRVAVSILSNSVYNAEQIRYRTFEHVGQRSTSLFGEEWIVRGVDGSLLPAPELTVILSGDSNADQVVNWQDAAYELAQLVPEPLGAAQLRQSYATITMNFASGGQYPFLRQLDNIKKFYLATDGFPQLLELKGYQSEGHDSGHPDYAGNYNTRAGGYQQLKSLIAAAQRYQAHIGVHINHSEAYPEAKAYTDRIMTDVSGWAWLDQAFLINKKQDILDGTFKQRIQNLKNELPDLAFVYLDTYREERAIADYTARLFSQMGWSIWTEEPNIFLNAASWTHHIPDSKSLIARFVMHQYRDGFAEHPLLLAGYDRGAKIGFMGWQKGRDFNQVLRNFFTLQLPYRYMMHYALKSIDEQAVAFEGGVRSFRVGDRQFMEKNGRAIKRGNAVFIPWDPMKEDKIYFYTDTTGTSRWPLPESWSDLKEVYLYKLSAHGKVLEQRIPVDKNDKSVLLPAMADQGYVIHKQVCDPVQEMNWGEGSGIINPGFDGGTKGWKFDHKDVAVVTLPYGQDVLRLQGNSAATQLIQLEKDSAYDISVWVQVNGQGTATVKVADKEICISESVVKNFFDNTDRYNTYFQRIKIPIVAHGDKVTLGLSFVGKNDSSAVYFDDVRVVKRKQDSTLDASQVYAEDFENIDEGWGPFIPSKPSAFKTHLSEDNGKYTDDCISGKFSLKTWSEGNGEVYRTSPTIIQLRALETYRLAFDFKSTKASVYEVVVRSTNDNKEVLRQKLDGSGRFNQSFTTGAQDDYYIAVIKSGQGTLIIDNFMLSH